MTAVQFVPMGTFVPWRGTSRRLKRVEMPGALEVVKESQHASVAASDVVATARMVAAASLENIVFVAEIVELGLVELYSTES